MPTMPSYSTPFLLATSLDECIEKIDALHTPLRQKTTHFELFLFFYLVTHLLLQNFNIYRLSFYNYNFYLLFLTILILLRRCLSKYFKYLRREREGKFNSLLPSSHYISLKVSPDSTESNCCYVCFLNKNFLSNKEEIFKGRNSKAENTTTITAATTTTEKTTTSPRVEEGNSTSTENNVTESENKTTGPVTTDSLLESLLSGNSTHFLRHTCRSVQSKPQSSFFNTNGTIGVCLNLLIILLICVNSTHLILQLFFRHPLKNFLFLFYPYMGSMLIFGVGGKKAKEKLQQSAFVGGESASFYVDPAERILYRLKRLLFNSFECGYYAGFLPLKFLQHDYLYYDPVRCTVLIVYVFINSLVMFSSRLLSTSFNELYSQSQILGCWRLLSPSTAAAHDLNSIENWSPPSSINKYKKGVVVKHKDGKLYQSITDLNNAEPGLLLPSLLFYLFENPYRTHTSLIMFQGFVVISQLALVFNSNHWNVYGLMLLFNYYIFYLCICTKRENLLYFPPPSFPSASLSSLSSTASNL